ncbi:MAG: DUF3459 domain-containing protein, partial [Chloroflexi bacterium]|nr:DUF3459 domain-containing protein [Chloroflexota bacterium]
QEFAASAPFLFFFDILELKSAVTEGRREFMQQFPSVAALGPGGALADPSEEETFLRCKLDFTEVGLHREAYQLHRDLLAVRRQDRVISKQGSEGIDGAVLGRDSFVIRYFSRNWDDRLLVVNLGVESSLDPAPEPLLAPPQSRRWQVRWSSESPQYGGAGILSPVDGLGRWRLQAEALVLLEAAREG